MGGFTVIIMLLSPAGAWAWLSLATIWEWGTDVVALN